MLRGLALAMLLVNLALLLWGSSRSGSQVVVVGERQRADSVQLSSLVLLEERPERAVAQAEDAVTCLRLGPLPAADADTLVAAIVAWDLRWRRSDSDDGALLFVEPDSRSAWREGDIRALADTLATEIIPCPEADPIALEPPRP